MEEWELDSEDHLKKMVPMLGQHCSVPQAERHGDYIADEVRQERSNWLSVEDEVNAMDEYCSTILNWHWVELDGNEKKTRMIIAILRHRRLVFPRIVKTQLPQSGVTQSGVTCAERQDSKSRRIINDNFSVMESKHMGYYHRAAPGHLVPEGLEYHSS